MRIKALSKLLYESATAAKPRVLRDEAVVVDGYNFFFLSYERSGLNYTLGCECDRYAAYLRDYVSMFTKANIKCYFFFKAGSRNMPKSFDKLKRKGCSFRPIFTKNIIMEIIEEYDFEYFVSEYNSKKDIIEFAQTLDCPIISYDAEYFFSGHQYIPSSSLRYTESDNSIHCDQLILTDFLTKYSLTADKMATFIVLTDENIYPERHFIDLFNHIKAPLGYLKRNLHLLTWLSRRTTDQISRTISLFLSAKEREVFVDEERKARLLIERRERGGFGAACMLDRGVARVARADPRWFVKGVALGHVATDYVNLYRHQHFYGSHVPADDERDDAMTISLEIVKYAYDLLTDFRNDGFKLVYDTKEGQETVLVGSTYSIRKPAYVCGFKECVFENGWGSVRSLGLMEHFLRATLQLESLRRVERAPAPARLLLLALAYCARRRPDLPRALPAVALLVHVALDLVHDRADMDNLPTPPFDRRPILDSATDKDDVTVEDCNIAAAILKAYYHVSDCDTEAMIPLDLKILHSLVEYQQVVVQLQALNALCGAALRAPVLARSYNGTLAYRLLHAAERAAERVAERAAERAADAVTFLDDLLSPAPTVYAYFNGLLETYEDL